MGSPWVHLRLCRSCGHVGCCDQSANHHARRHFEATGHPIIEGYDPLEGWGWWFIDDIEVDLASPHIDRRACDESFANYCSHNCGLTHRKHIALYSINSSARSRTDSGMVSPSA
jgi:hypothetical protein